jgi:hypothetical protein
VFLYFICDINGSRIGFLSQNKGSVRRNYESLGYKHHKNDRALAQGLSGTNLTTTKIYCIQEKSGKLLGWNGKRDNNEGRIYGLSLSQKSDMNCTKNNSFLFTIEVKGDYIQIRNKETQLYISYYMANFCLAKNGLLNNDLRLVIQPDKLINLVNDEDMIYMSSKNIIRDNIYMNFGTKQFWEIGYWNFIPFSDLNEEETDENNGIAEQNLSLSAHVRSFEYETPDDEVVQNKTISLSLLSTTISNNSSHVSITHEISNEQLIKDSLQWNFEGNLFENFCQVQIDRDLPSIITQKSGFNSIYFDFNPELLQTVDYSKNKVYNYGKVYSFKRSITLPPKTAVDVNAYINQVIDLEIPFEAVAEITAKKSTVDLSGQEIVNIISNIGSDFPILSVNNNSVIIYIRGGLIATFGLRSYFNVIDV